MLRGVGLCGSFAGTFPRAVVDAANRSAPEREHSGVVLAALRIHHRRGHAVQHHQTIFLVLNDISGYQKHRGVQLWYLSSWLHLRSVRVNNGFSMLLSAPSCEAHYLGFSRCPVHFDAEASAILFACADVDRPLPAANRELEQANDPILIGFLDKLHEDDLVTRVKTAIVEELPSGSPRDDMIAKSVFMSFRTLNRRLAAVGTTYSQHLDAVRWELAEQYITDPSLSLGEISFLLGFAEHSSFSRAFRRWTGGSPSAARDTAAA